MFQVNIRRLKKFKSAGKFFRRFRFISAFFFFCFTSEAPYNYCLIILPEQRHIL